MKDFLKYALFGIGGWFLYKEFFAATPAGTGDPQVLPGSPLPQGGGATSTAPGAAPASTVPAPPTSNPAPPANQPAPPPANTAPVETTPAPTTTLSVPNTTAALARYALVLQQLAAAESSGGHADGRLTFDQHGWYFANATGKAGPAIEDAMPGTNRDTIITSAAYVAAAVALGY